MLSLHNTILLVFTLANFRAFALTHFYSFSLAPMSYLLPSEIMKVVSLGALLYGFAVMVTVSVALPP
jgi:hypothetical protein